MNQLENEAPRIIPPAIEPPLILREPEPALHTTSYIRGYQDGFAVSDNSSVTVFMSGCGMLALLLTCVVLIRYVSRLANTLLQNGSTAEHGARAKRFLSTLLPLLLCVSMTGCAAKTDMQEPLPPVPLPPQSALAAAPAPEQPEGQTLTVHLPADTSGSPRQGEPEELATLLEMKGTSENESAVSLMRPTAIREAAQLVTFQTAIAYRYKQLVAATEQHSSIMDTAFNFSPLLMTQGDALILPPVLTRAGASMRIESGETATTVQTSYELLAPARYVATVPTWREFLMTDGFPEPEKPNPAVMPKNDKERLIWRAAVREAWAQGLTEADHLYADNVSRMVRTYRGVMLYHLLTAQHLLSRVNTASAELGSKTTDSGNKLHIGQKVYRITAPSAFIPAQTVPANSKNRK